MEQSHLNFSPYHCPWSNFWAKGLLFFPLLPWYWNPSHQIWSHQIRPSMPQIFFIGFAWKMQNPPKTPYCHSIRLSTLSTFTDVDWTRDPSDRRSTIGLLVFLGSNSISWSFKKQTTVSQSSIEVEYRALVTIVAKISWPHIIFK